MGRNMTAEEYRKYARSKKQDITDTKIRNISAEESERHDTAMRTFKARQERTGAYETGTRGKVAAAQARLGTLEEKLDTAKKKKTLGYKVESKIGRFIGTALAPSRLRAVPKVMTIRDRADIRDVEKRKMKWYFSR